MARPRVMIVVGYFDWFSGYQETVLAAALGSKADVHVVASDRVSPSFSDQHLTRLGVARRYTSGNSTERGVKVTRLNSLEWRGMVWATGVRRAIRVSKPDLIIQMMPGQALPISATFSARRIPRFVIYGDNGAMWTGLSPWKRALKGLVFGMTKGVAYRIANRGADAVLGYTPETLTRLAPTSRQPLTLLPLAYADEHFFFSPELRASERAKRAYSPSDIVFVSAGKFAERKRLDLIVRAFKSLCAAVPQASLLLVGSDGGQVSGQLETLVARLGLTDRVRIEGFLPPDQLNAALNASDIGIWPRQPAITIQQGLATGLWCVLPSNDWVGHLLTQDTGTYMPANPSESEVLAGLLVASNCDRHSDVRESRARLNSRFSGRSAAQFLLDLSEALGR